MSEKRLNSLAIAEQKAAEIVKRANERKQKLLDEASAAADKEIAVLREKYQKEFEGKTYDITKEEQEQAVLTQRDIEEVTRQYEEHASACIDMMLERITRVDVKVSRNVKADFSKL